MRSRTLAGNWRARLGVTAIFGALGMLSGSFAARVPATRGQLHLDAAGLGTALLGPALGSVLSAPLTAAALRRVTPRRWILAGLVPFACLLPLSMAAGLAVTVPLTVTAAGRSGWQGRLPRGGCGRLRGM